MRIKPTFDGNWLIFNAFDNCIAEFANRADAELFIASKALLVNAKIAQERYYNEPIEENQQRAISLLNALTEEAIEALRELPSRKAWSTKDYANKPINYEAYYTELCDIQLFLLAIVLWSGLNLQDFLNLCIKKQNKNTIRRDHANSKA